MIVIVDAAIHDPLIDVDTILHLLDEGSPHFSLIHSFIDYIFCRDYRRNSWRDRRSRSRSPGRYRSSQSFRRRWDTFCVSRVNNVLKINLYKLDLFIEVQKEIEDVGGLVLVVGVVLPHLTDTGIGIHCVLYLSMNMYIVYLIRRGPRDKDERSKEHTRGRRRSASRSPSPDRKRSKKAKKEKKRHKRSPSPNETEGNRVYLIDFYYLTLSSPNVYL